MKISVKTLKGEQFQIEVDPSIQISAVKENIATQKPEFPAARQKLIHSGKVLKDDQVLSDTGIAENEFLVCMLTKEAKPKPQAQSSSAPTPPAATVTTPQVSSPAPQTTQQTATTTPSTNSTAPSSTSTTTPAPTTQTQGAPPAPTRDNTLDPAAIRQLMDMGFPEEEATTSLRAAMGNADVAVEFLMNGIPPHALAAAGMGGTDQSMEQSMDEGSGSGGAGGGAGGIEQLRSHPQLNELRRVVQSNPSALSQVLEAIGQQNPELLQLIHANQAEFLAMMNEPITEDPAPQQQQQQGQGGQQLPPGNLPSGEPNPMQLIQMIQMLPEEQRAAAAQSLGMTPEQLQHFSQMISQLPPDQLQRLMGQAGGMGGAGGGPPAGQNVIRLTDEEMNAVTRLTEMGFDQQDAVAAYLACDKNEALAANLLLEGWNAEDGGGGF